MSPSNQGRDLSLVLEDVLPADLAEATKAGYVEYRRHPLSSSCDCPTLETLARLYELGYRLTKPPSTSEDPTP